MNNKNWAWSIHEGLAWFKVQGDKHKKENDWKMGKWVRSIKQVKNMGGMTDITEVSSINGASGICELKKRHEKKTASMNLHDIMWIRQLRWGGEHGGAWELGNVSMEWQSWMKNKAENSEAVKTQRQTGSSAERVKWQGHPV